jgi:hypothetical protein
MKHLTSFLGALLVAVGTASAQVPTEISGGQKIIGTGDPGTTYYAPAFAYAPSQSQPCNLLDRSQQTITGQCVFLYVQGNAGNQIPNNPCPHDQILRFWNPNTWSGLTTRFTGGDTASTMNNGVEISPIPCSQNSYFGGPSVFGYNGKLYMTVVESQSSDASIFRKFWWGVSTDGQAWIWSVLLQYTGADSSLQIPGMTLQPTQINGVWYFYGFLAVQSNAGIGTSAIRLRASSTAPGYDRVEIYGGGIWQVIQNPLDYSSPTPDKLVDAEGTPMFLGNNELWVTKLNGLRTCPTPPTTWQGWADRMAYHQITIPSDPASAPLFDNLPPPRPAGEGTYIASLQSVRSMPSNYDGGRQFPMPLGPGNPRLLYSASNDLNYGGGAYCNSSDPGVFFGMYIVLTGLQTGAQAPPTVSSISPTSGPTAGGTSVTVTGTNFVAGATVALGGASATGVTVVNSVSITATSGAHVAGAVNVVVTNSDSQSGTLTNGYTYSSAAPTVTLVSPTSGPAAGGTAVTVTGTNFVAGATLTLGGVPATGVTFVSSTSITATTGAHAAGAVNVVVTNPDTQSGTRTNGFTYTSTTAPTVTSIGPNNSGPAAGGTFITVTGSNFVAGATVTLGGVSATGVTVVNSTSITGTTGAHAAGAVNVVVTNPNGESGTLTNGYTYLAAPHPTVASVSPNSGPAAGGTFITVTGSNFVAGATLKLGGVSATGVTVVNSTSITATTAAHAAGTVNVVVTNPDAQSGTRTNGYTYLAPPTVASVSPNLGPAAGGTFITVTGTNFVAGATVALGGVSAAGVTVANSTSITATTGAHAAGAVNVVVTNPDSQSGTLTNGYTYRPPPPTVASISPNSGPAAGGTFVTVTGTNFVSGATFKLGGTSATGVTVVNSTTLTGTTGSHAAGLVKIEVTNPDGQKGTKDQAFTYN